jgi:chromosome segregation ATPase
MTIKTIEQIYRQIAEDERIAPQVRLNAATQWRELLEARPAHSMRHEIEQLREVLSRERERHRCEIEGYKNEIERLYEEMSDTIDSHAETTAELKQARETSRIQNCYMQDTQAALEKEREDRKAAHAQLEVTERKLEHCRELLKAARASTVAVCELANARDTELSKNEAALIALIRRIEAEHAKGGDISIYFRRHYGHQSVQIIGDGIECRGDSLTQIALELEEVSDVEEKWVRRRAMEGEIVRLAIPNYSGRNNGSGAHLTVTSVAADGFVLTHNDMTIGPRDYEVLELRPKEKTNES